MDFLIIAKMIFNFLIYGARTRCSVRKYDENHLLPENSSRGKTYNPLFPALKDLLATA